MKTKHLKEAAVIVLIFVFLAVYFFVPSVNQLVSRLVRPAVVGAVQIYSKISSALYRKTGMQLGYVVYTRDPEFSFRANVADLINSHHAAPLLQIAMNRLNSDSHREAALKALLKFDSINDWIQPFLNEIFKGGMYGLYDETPNVLDDLIKRVRAEGGIANPLVRAYAEVVFPFMLQAPDAIVRKKAVRWVADVIPEESLFLIASRLGHETDPLVQKEMEKAILDIRVVSDSARAVFALSPFFKAPPWPEVRFPLAVVLGRLGDLNANAYVRSLLGAKQLTDEQIVYARLALAGTRYPREVVISPQVLKARRERELVRQKTVSKPAAVSVESIREALMEPKKTTKVAKAVTPPVPAVPSAPVAPKVPDVSHVPAPIKTLPPPPPEPVLPPPPSPPPLSSSPAEENTYFRAAVDGVPAYEKPTIDSKQKSILDAIKAYKAIKSEKVGADRWFLLELEGGAQGWVEGINIQLAEVESYPTKSAFQAEWVTASVKGVSVYGRPSIAADELRQISPPEVYRVVEVSEGGGQEWYKIDLSKGKEGWVQAMDVSLTKPK